MISLSLDELLAYTDEERGKWRTWLEAHPAAMDLRLQPEGRFATVAALGARQAGMAPPGHHDFFYSRAVD